MDERPSSPSPRSGRWIPIALGVLVLLGIAGGLTYLQLVNPALPPTSPLTQSFSLPSPLPTPTPDSSVTPTPATAGVDAMRSPLPEPQPTAMASPGTAVDLAVNANALSHATVVIKTDKGDIQFKFYAEDAPRTTQRDRKSVV